jgi:hypothetical protein
MNYVRFLYKTARLIIPKSFVIDVHGLIISLEPKICQNEQNNMNAKHERQARKLSTHFYDNCLINCL